MGTGKQYDEEFKKQAIKLAKEVGTKAAADELCIPKGTLGTWVQRGSYYDRLYDWCPYVGTHRKLWGMRRADRQTQSRP